MTIIQLIIILLVIVILFQLNHLIINTRSINIIPLFSERFIEDVDIDTERDFRLAELITNNLII